LPKVSDFLSPSQSVGTFSVVTALTNMQCLCMGSTEGITCMCSWLSM